MMSIAIVYIQRLFVMMPCIRCCKDFRVTDGAQVPAPLNHELAAREIQVVCQCQCHRRLWLSACNDGVEYWMNARDIKLHV